MHTHGLVGSSWPAARSTPPADDEPPMHVDLRTSEGKPWAGKVTVTLDGVDVSATVVAAHEGEGWAVLTTQEPRNLDTDPLAIRRGKVRLTKKA